METPVSAAVRPPGGIFRRTAAMLAIVLLLGLALAMMWRVYLHHERSIAVPDEPALVRYGAAAASAAKY